MRYFMLLFLLIYPLLTSLSISHAQPPNIAPMQFETKMVLGFGRINEVAIHPDNQTIAIASQAGLSLYDLDTLIPLHHLLWNSKGVQSVSWSADGKTLIAGAFNRIIFWSFSRVNNTVQAEEILTIETSATHSLFLSPDEGYLAGFYSESYWGYIEVWEISIEQRNARLFFTSESEMGTAPDDPDLSETTTMAWSPDSKRLLITDGTDYWMIDMFPEVEFQYLFKEEAASLDAPTVVWSPDGQFLAYYSNNEPGLKVWDVGQQQLVRTIPLNLQIDRYLVQDMYWLEHHILLTYTNSYSMLDVITIDTQTWEVSLKQSFELRAGGEANFSESLEYFTIYDEALYSLRVWRMSDWQLIGEIPVHGGRRQSGQSFIWLGDDRVLSTVHGLWGGVPRLYLWDSRTGELLDSYDFSTLNYEDELIHAAFSPNGTELYTDFYLQLDKLWSVKVNDDQLEVTLTAIASQRPDYGLNMPTYYAYEAASPNGSWLAVPVEPDYRTEKPISVHILDAESGEVLYALSTHQGSNASVRVFAWSPDSNYLAIGFVDGKIEMWDLRSDEPINVLLKGGHYAMGYDGYLEGHVLLLQWSPDGSQLMSFGTDGTIHIWGMPE